MSTEEDYRETLGSTYTPGGASMEQIEAAERELGVAFPPSYRQFLAEYGAAVGTGFEVAGLFLPSDDGEPPKWKNVLVVSKQMRRILGETMAPSLIPIADDGHGVTFYISGDVEGERVVAYGPGIDGAVVARSFPEFVVKAAQGPLESLY